jgi:two-component system, sensor histidine kinase PdtaS
MNLAYERLFESATIARLELGSYLRALWDIMIDIYPAPIATAAFELEEVVAVAEEAVPFGLFATEAITNAILYGAGPEGWGEVTIELRHSGQGVVELVVRDRGPGLPAGAEGLGLRLMDALGAQLRGRVERENDGGALVRLRFASAGPSHA